MMKKLFQIEMRKYRGLPIIHLLSLSIIINVAICALIIFRVKGADQLGGIIKLYQVFDNNAVFKIVTAPVILASLASMAVQLENRHKMWKVLQNSGVDYYSVYTVKFIYIYLCYLASQIIEWGIILFLVNIHGFTVRISLGRMGLFAISMALVSAVVLLLHYILSLKWTNQLISLSIALVGSLIGIIVLLVSRTFVHIWIYSWYGLLISVDMERVGSEFIGRLKDFYAYPLIASLILGVIFFQLGKHVKVGD